MAIIPSVATRRGWKVYALSLEDIREIFEIKQLVEGMMVRKAAGCEDEELWAALKEEHMTGIGAGRIAELRQDFDKVLHVLERCEVVDKQLQVPTEEFTRRQRATWRALQAAGLDVGFVFSDEHYDGDVPYLGGNTNVLESEEPLGRQIVTMLDVAVRGVSDYWNDVIIPDMDYVVEENTLGKFETRVETFNRLPLNVQSLVGAGS